MSALSLVLFQIVNKKNYAVLVASQHRKHLPVQTPAGPGVTGAKLPITAWNVNKSKHGLLWELLSEVYSDVFHLLPGLREKTFVFISSSSLQSSVVAAPCWMERKTETETKRETE